MPRRPGEEGSGLDTDGAENLVHGIRKSCNEVIYPHIFGNSDREVGGVLVGWSSGDRLPVIVGAIPAISADEQRSTLTFTQDSWEHIHQVMDEEFPDDQIVGWYHSHPGFGIFLSGHDMFIQENFFSGPSQVALVIDPLAGTEGVFAWVDGEVEQIIDRGTPEPWEPLEPGTRPYGLSTIAAEGSGAGPSREPENRKLNPGIIVSLIALALLGVVIGFGGYRVLDQSGKDADQPAGKSTPVPPETESSEEGDTEADKARGAVAPEWSETQGPAPVSPAAPGGSVDPTETAPVDTEPEPEDKALEDQITGGDTGG